MVSQLVMTGYVIRVLLLMVAIFAAVSTGNARPVEQVGIRPVIPTVPTLSLDRDPTGRLIE